MSFAMRHCLLALIHKQVMGILLSKINHNKSPLLPLPPLLRSTKPGYFGSAWEICVYELRTSVNIPTNHPLPVYADAKRFLF